MTKILREAMLEDLARSNLDEEDAKLLQISCTAHTLKPAGQAYTIPYFDSKGNKTKFYRIRYISTAAKGFSALTGEKQRRYNQPPGTNSEIYLPPYLNWEDLFKDHRQLIVITEGEKKAASACKVGIATIGLGGVWNFTSRRSGEALLAVFDAIDLKDRPIIICYDSDAAFNPGITSAEDVLARRLLGRGAVISIARIPHEDKKMGIDDYLLEYGVADFRRYVLTKAYVHKECETLHKLNEELVYLTGPEIIYSYKASELSGKDKFIQPRNFVHHSHSNVFAYVDTPAGLVRKPAAKLWLAWEHRAELNGITYMPGHSKVTESRELNVWPGWGVNDAVKGSIEPWNKLLDHLFQDAEPKAREWFEQWCAYPIQHPGYKMASAAVLWGVTQGTGKTLCGHTLMKLYGKNATEVKDNDLSDARFSWAEHKQFVLADDITGHDSRKLSNMFKTMVTQKTIHVNPKFIQSYTIVDCINYYFTSNDPDAFYLDDNDRRFFIHEVTSDKLPIELRKAYMKWFNNEEGISALFYYLLNLDVSDFDPQAEALQTSAKREMIHVGKSELGAWVSKLKEEPSAILNGKIRGDLFTAEELYVLYDPFENKRASPNALAREMKRSGFIKLQNPSGGAMKVGERQLRLYAVRNLDQWKAASRKNIIEHYTETHKSKF